VSPQQGSDSRAGDEAGEQGSDDGVGGRLALRGALKADQEDLPDDLFSAVAKELEALVKRGENRFPEARPCDGDTDAGARLVDRVMGETRRLTAQLHGIVQSETMTRHRTARRGRRLSAPHLHRVAVGDDRVFDRIEERRAPNTAIHLLVDMSGSMDPPKCTLAMDAALALALALESMRGVSLAATAFPHVEWHSDNANAVTAMLLRGQSVRARAGAFVQRARGGTPLTAALWFTAAELLAASEPRKVAIVLTDGEPNDRHSAWDIVQRMAAAGIETVGIGIFYEVSWLFPTHVTISRLNQLKPELMRIARQLLIA
jgi:Mg-chelatase subunit ChlD